MVLNMFVTKEHRTWEGLSLIVALKALLPLGLSPEIRKAFPNLLSVEKPVFTPSSDPLDPHWLAGFVNGDGCFTLGSEPSNSSGNFICNPAF